MVQKCLKLPKNIPILNPVKSGLSEQRLAG